MSAIPCDLNDIHTEPSDEQLALLMNAVAEEARRKAMEAKARLIEHLRAEVEKAVARQNAL